MPVSGWRGVAAEDGATAALIGIDGQGDICRQAPVIPAGFPAPASRRQPPGPKTHSSWDVICFLTRLSGNGTQACASCHEQNTPSPMIKTFGSTGEPVTEQPGTDKCAYNGTLTWANLTTIESQILVRYLAKPGGAGGRHGRRGDSGTHQAPHYAELLAAFPEDFLLGSPSTLAPGQDLTSQPNKAWDVIVKALATLSAGDFRKRPIGSYTGRQRCHDRRTPGIGTVFRTAGMSPLPWLLHASVDHAGLTSSSTCFTTRACTTPTATVPLTSVFGLTETPKTWASFAPAFNVELTAPYTDGSVGSLEDVIDIYAAGGRNLTDGPDAGDGRTNPYKSGFVPGFNITADEKADLVAFLKSLTDWEFVCNPRFSYPFETGTSALHPHCASKQRE